MRKRNKPHARDTLSFGRDCQRKENEFSSNFLIKCFSYLQFPCLCSADCRIIHMCPIAFILHVQPRFCSKFLSFRLYKPGTTLISMHPIRHMLGHLLSFAPSILTRYCNLNPSLSCRAFPLFTSSHLSHTSVATISSHTPSHPILSFSPLSPRPPPPKARPSLHDSRGPSGPPFPLTLPLLHFFTNALQALWARPFEPLSFGLAVCVGVVAVMGWFGKESCVMSLDRTTSLKSPRSLSALAACTDTGVTFLDCDYVAGM